MNEISWTKTKGLKFEALLDISNYYIYIKYQDYVSEFLLSDYVDDFVYDIEASVDKAYLYVGESLKISYKVISVFGSIDDVFCSTKDNNIAVISDDSEIIGLSKGVTQIIFQYEDYTGSIPVVISDLFFKPEINNKKPFLDCNKYSEEDANLLDSIMEWRISNKGYGTRAGVVEAMRFITLQLPFKLNYFPENGRLDYNANRRYVDGEGRYYHKGFYLSENKFSSIVATSTGPAIWGCPLLVSGGEEDQPAGNYYSNGLDCSGFITWGLYNGGFDVGDLGAGYSSINNLSKLGEHLPITYDLLSSGRVKAGDLIGIDGHSAMIIGIDNNNVYVADILIYNEGTRVRKFAYKELVNYPYFDYINLMDSVYKSDGNYTNMW